MPKLTPSQKGAAAEAAFTAAAIELGFVVLRPLCEGGRYDLILDLMPELVRVQCKWGRCLSGVITVKVATSRYTPNGYVRTTYSAEEVDAIGIYSPDLTRCFLIPIDEITDARNVHLRIAHTGNNQARGIRWAKDYELADSIGRYRRRGRPGSQSDLERAIA